MWLAATALFFVLRAGGAIRSVPLCFWLSAVAGALFFSLDQLRVTGPAHPLLRVRQVVLVVVLVAMPSLFDPTTVEVDNLPRLVVLLVAGVLLLGIWGVDAVWSGWRPWRLVNGLQWVLLAIVAWFGVTTVTSVEPRLSLLGRDGSYEGFVLLAALAVVTLALAESFTARALPALLRVVVASAVPVLVYGVIQLYGFDVDKSSPWDFVRWHNAYHNVFATFGNPNHLGGYLVTILPLGVVTAVLTKHRWLRVALWGWVALTLVLLLQTGARGAWLGALAGGAVLVVGLLPRVRASARTVGLVAGGGLVVAVVLIGAGSRFLGAKASALFQFGSNSSVSQRYGYWRAALSLAGHHPLVGTGPDTYAVTYARYEDAALAKVLGSTFFVNGAHNIFLSWLANEGVPGLLLVVVLFVFGVAWGVRAWRSFRSEAADTEATDRGAALPADARRYVVAALMAGLVAYFVQACFDVEQIATLVTMFIVLGLLGTVNRGVWPVSTLLGHPFHRRDTRPDAEVPPAEEDADYPVLPASVGAYGRSRSDAQRELRRLAGAVGAGIIGLTAVSLTFWRADALWRADHQAWLATQVSLESATKLNPWEPSYFETLSQAAMRSYSEDPTASDALTIVEDGVSWARQADALDGSSSSAQAEYGIALEVLAHLESSNKTLLRMALAALRRAQQDNPFNTQVPPVIAAVQRSLDGP